MNINNTPIEVFKSNIDSVHKLMNFDRDVLSTAIESIRELHDIHVSKGNINEIQNGKRALDILTGIQDHDSLKLRYSVVYNQAVVLLVSYFSSALSDLFRFSTKIAIDNNDKRVLTEDINVDVRELLEKSNNISEYIGDLIINKKDISFQDMKSVHRNFKKYFLINIERNSTVNNIILGQACRNSIVHDGGRVNDRTINQIRNALPRDLKLNITLNDNISFNIDEIEILSNNMLTYCDSLMNEIGLKGSEPFSR